MEQPKTTYVAHCAENSKGCKFLRHFRHMVVAEALAKIHTKLAEHSVAVYPTRIYGNQ